MKPNFKNIDIKTAGIPSTDPKAWEKEQGIEKNWNTPEQIKVKPVYTKADLEGMEHLGYAAGVAPSSVARTA